MLEGLKIQPDSSNKNGGKTLMTGQGRKVLEVNNFKYFGRKKLYKRKKINYKKNN